MNILVTHYHIGILPRSKRLCQVNQDIYIKIASPQDAQIVHEMGFILLDTVNVSVLK
jgi:hypothetical protein